MDLLDRYLGAVSALLPAAQRQDIVAELRDLLESRIEEKEAQQGRRLDKAEIETLLREFGHPLAVAGRYGPQRALIGAELYPFYIFAVKVGLAIAAFVALIPAMVDFVTQQPHGPGLWQSVGHALDGFTESALSLIGVITLIGAAIERGWIKTGDFGKWRVADLPYAPPKKGWFRTTRFEALFEVVFMVLFVLWWAGLVDFPIARDGFGQRDGLTWTLAPILTQLHLPILLMAIGQVISSLLVVLRPGWVGPRAVAEIVLSVAGIALAALLWQAMPLVTFAGPADAAEGIATLQLTVDNVFKGSCLVAVAICAGKILIEGWRLARLGRR